VRDVADDVREDQERARDDDRGLHDGVILRYRGLERQSPEARPVEDALDDELAAEEEQQDRAEGRHARDERIAQHVDRDDSLLAETLAPRRAHIVLRDDFEDLRSQDAWEVRDAGNRQHEDRADEVPCTIPADRAVRADDVHAPDREPPVLHGERQHEDEAEPEFGDRVTDHAEDADPVILDAPAPQGSDDAERDAHADDEDEREERELKTVRNALEDEIEGGPVVVDRVAEVEVRELPEPFRELHGEGLVEAERVVELSAVLLRDLGVPVEHELHRVRRRQPREQECEQKDAEERGDRLHETPRDETTHLTPARVAGPAPCRPRVASLPDYFLNHHFSIFQVELYVLGSTLWSCLFAKKRPSAEYRKVYGASSLSAWSTFFSAALRAVWLQSGPLRFSSRAWSTVGLL